MVYTHLKCVDSNVDYLNVDPSYILDVDDTTNVKFRTTVTANEEMDTEANNARFRVDIIRLEELKLWQCYIQK